MLFSVYTCSVDGLCIRPDNFALSDDSRCFYSAYLSSFIIISNFQSIIVIFVTDDKEQRNILTYSDTISKGQNLDSNQVKSGSRGLV